MPAKWTVTLRGLIAALLLPVLVAGCSQTSEGDRGPVVLAAASLQDALDEVAGEWAAQGHLPPRLSFAGSSALARQIEQGAPADLFLSADEQWMDELERGGWLRPGTRSDLLSNRIVLVTRKGSGVTGLGQLGDGRLALADPEAVPAGRYARSALVSLGRWDQVAGRIAPAENVRAALALVERGEAPLGIVYATDARASGAVEVLEVFPANGHPPIRYPGAVLAASEHPEAGAFLAFLVSERARAIFERHGFGRAG